MAYGKSGGARNGKLKKGAVPNVRSGGRMKQPTRKTKVGTKHKAKYTTE